MDIFGLPSNFTHWPHTVQKVSKVFKNRYFATKQREKRTDTDTNYGDDSKTIPHSSLVTKYLAVKCFEGN